jgi:hypothetical protein
VTIKEFLKVTNQRERSIKEAKFVMLNVNENKSI